MKWQWKSAITLSFILIICLVVAVLLAAMKKMYIESWFLLNRNVMVGFLSGLLLTFVVSLSNFAHTQRTHARERAAALDAFSEESSALQALIGDFGGEENAPAIPESSQLALGQTLAHLVDRVNAIQRNEKISPRTSRSIQKGGLFVSSIVKSELAFDLAFAAFEEGCVKAYHTFSSLPFLTDAGERQQALEGFSRQLRELSSALAVGSALSYTMADFRAAIRKAFGEKRTPA